MFDIGGDRFGECAPFGAPKLRTRGRAGANGIDVENAVLLNCQVWAVGSTGGRNTLIF